MNTYMKVEDRIALPIGKQPDDDSYRLDAVYMTETGMAMLAALVTRPNGKVHPDVKTFMGIEVKSSPNGLGNFAVWIRPTRAVFAHPPEPYVRDDTNLALSRQGYQAWLDELPPLPE